MADIAASVLAKLRNKAKTSGVSYQQCLQLFMQKRWKYFLNNIKKESLEISVVIAEIQTLGKLNLISIMTVLRTIHTQRHQEAALC